MLDQKNKVVKPFVVAYPVASAKVAPAPKRPGTHMSKDEATREVLARIATRIKKI
jgi:hypothetical protein